jgi:hypothetical protein
VLVRVGWLGIFFGLMGRKEDIKKFENQHQETGNASDLDVIFGDEWSDQIHEIPASDIWSKEIDSKFLEFVMKKKEDVSGEAGSSTVQANAGRASLKVDCDFKPLLNVNKGTFRDAGLERLIATHRPGVAEKFFSTVFLR